MISVAICTHNGDRFLSAQLQSILQNAPSEIILCDDASTDNTQSIIEQFLQKTTIPIHYYPNQVPLGITKNFEKAISLCSGDIIFLADQDDIWHPEKIEKISYHFQNNSEIMAIFTNAKIVNENLDPLGYPLWETVGFNPIKQTDWKNGKAVDTLLQNNMVTGATLAFRASCKERILPIPEIAFHDAWIALIIAFTGQINFLDEPLIQYRQHDRNQIGSRRKSFLAKSRERLNSTVHQRLLLQFRELSQRLTQLDIDPVSAEKMDKLAEKIEHLQARANFSSHRLARLPILLNELRSGRYHRYASGWLSLIRDFMV